MSSRFGGIWVDGNVETPVDECFCEAGRLLVLDRFGGGLDLVQKDKDRVDWGEYWWLDRRIPKSLLPEEAFDLLKILHPGVAALRLGSDGGWETVDEWLDGSVAVDWGGRKFYSPPGPERWVEVTADNWMEYWRWECEYGSSEDCGVGTLIGRNLDDRFVLLRKGGGVRFSDQVRVKVGVDGKSVLATEGGTGKALPSVK